MSDPQEIVGKGFVDLYPENSELNRASNRKILENGYKIRNVETEEIGVDGKPRHFLLNVVCDVRDGYQYLRQKKTRKRTPSQEVLSRRE